MQAIALSLAESLENSVPAMSGETPSTGMKGSGSTPCKKNNTVPIQDSAKTMRIKKQVCCSKHGLYKFPILSNCILQNYSIIFHCF